VNINKEDGTNIPMFLWSNIVNLNTAKENLKKHTFIHEKASESILGCIGVKSDNINQENNVCSKKYR
jgi:glucan phosphoethanolaminetransferase (alkaline phosphatase superfamily)